MLAVLLLLLIDVYILINTGKKTETQINTPAPEGGVSKKEWTVYGTSWCGWTKKQLAYLEKKGIPHKFIDCEKGNCDGIEAFPVMKSSDGEEVVGYKEI
jgi:hypothetical protein|tara:strand:- start:890 stop:1186 length:297 start_codon:yes stop_codon:yes gene_type:complete